MPDISSTADIIDIRDVIARIEELEAEKEAYEPGEDNEAAWEIENEDDAQELKGYLTLMDELRGNGGDEQWKGDWYPITLIRDSYFVDAM